MQHRVCYRTHIARECQGVTAIIDNIWWMLKSLLPSCTLSKSSGTRPPVAKATGMSDLPLDSVLQGSSDLCKDIFPSANDWIKTPLFFYLAIQLHQPGLSRDNHNFTTSFFLPIHKICGEFSAFEEDQKNFWHIKLLGLFLPLRYKGICRFVVFWFQFPCLAAHTTKKARQMQPFTAHVKG